MMCQCEFFGHDERRREEIAEDRGYQGASFLSLIGVSFRIGASVWVLHLVWEIQGYFLLHCKYIKLPSRMAQTCQ